MLKTFAITCWVMAPIVCLALWAEEGAIPAVTGACIDGIFGLGFWLASQYSFVG
jgi:hypothetical protein